MERIQLLQIKDVMTNRPARIRDNADVYRAAEIVGFSRVSDLMVVDDNDNFIGVLSEGDILHAALPDIDEILKEGGSLDTAYNIFMNKGRNLGDLPISPLIIREPIVVDPDDHIAKATTVLLDRHIGVLPVVKNGQLVGTISRADVCRAVVGTL